MSTLALQDPVEFGLFYARTLPKVYAYLYARCGRRPEVAQDLTQEVFAAAVVAVRRGVHDVEIAWLIGVARHKLVDHFRAREREERGLRQLEQRSACDDEVARWQLESSRDTAVRVLAELAPDQRVALVLFHLEGRSVPEVAAHIGRSVHATESLLSRARRAFRTTLLNDCKC